MAKATGKTYQLKIGLEGSSPPIWRRIPIADSVSLARFHDIIQIAMGWTHSHLHRFICDGKYYGRPTPISIPILRICWTSGAIVSASC